ncbi:MAG: zinc-ribbon domain-containing protein [Dehalococcoidia bacterium]
MASEMIFCIECGARLPAAAKFCNVCGTRVIVAESESPTTESAWSPPSAENEAPDMESAWSPPSAETEAPAMESAWSPPGTETEAPAEPPSWSPVGAQQTTEISPAASHDTAPITSWGPPESETAEPPEAFPEPLVTAEPALDPEAEQRRVWVDDIQPAKSWQEQTQVSPATADFTAETQVPGYPAAPTSSGEMVETRHYDTKEEIRREDLGPMPVEEDIHTTRPIAPAYYDDDAGGFSLRPGMLMAAIGFAVTIAGVFFAWVSIEETEVKALDETIQAEIRGESVEGTFPFQVQDALDSTTRVDAFLVIAIAGAGLFFLLVEYFILRRLAVGRIFAALGGLAVGALGVVELLYVRDAVPEDISFSYEPGLFMVIFGGATAIVGSLIPVGSPEEE